METKAHQVLKRLAMQHLRQIGCVAIAAEVRCPISRFRVDVAGYRDRRPSVVGARPLAVEPCTVMIECKQSRQDFLRDREQIEPLLQLRNQLEGIRRSIQEHRIKRVEPQLRRAGTSLFAELDEWDIHASRLPGYRKVMRQLRRVDEKLHGETKFFLMARYCLADQMYLAAPRGMIRPREVPPGWGLLECLMDPMGGALDPEIKSCVFNFETRLAAPQHVVKPKHRQRLLRNIAVAACRHLHEAHEEVRVRAT